MVFTPSAQELITLAQAIAARHKSKSTGLRHLAAAYLIAEADRSVYLRLMPLPPPLLSDRLLKLLRISAAATENVGPSELMQKLRAAEFDGAGVWEEDDRLPTLLAHVAVSPHADAEPPVTVHRLLIHDLPSPSATDIQLLPVQPIDLRSGKRSWTMLATQEAVSSGNSLVALREMHRPPGAVDEPRIPVDVFAFSPLLMEWFWTRLEELAPRRLVEGGRRHFREAERITATIEDHRETVTVRVVEGWRFTEPFRFADQMIALLANRGLPSELEIRRRN